MSDELIKELKDKGIIKLENFIAQSELSELSEIVRYYSAPKSSKYSYWSVGVKGLFLKLLLLNFRRFNYNLKLLNFEKKKNLKKFADQYFSNISFLSYVDAYYNKISNKNIIPWHTDQAYNGEVTPKKIENPNNYYLKFFLYLTDIEPDNGCMAYIPGSHKIGYAIRKGIYEKKILYSPYWHLKDIRKIILKKENQMYFNEYFKKNLNVLKTFLDNTEFIEKSNDTLEYDYKLKAGSAIIFDEGGIHRGAKTLKNDRMVIRYFYSQKK